MSLKQLVELTRVQVPVTADVSVPVRGLSAADIIGLVSRHRESADKLFADLSGDQGNTLVSAPESLAQKFFNDAPDLVADAIAVATGNPDERDAAGELPVGLQIKILEAMIGATTFVDGGLGELLETVIGAMVGTSAVVKKLTDLPR